MAEVSCPQCGHRNPMGSRFCSSCGASLDNGEAHTTMSVVVPIDSAAEEVEVDIDELPAGVGMLVVTRGPNSGSKFALDEPLVTAGRHPDSVIFLEVRTDNAPAIGLYESFGFVNVGLRRRYYRASGADAFTMKRLPQEDPL